MDYTSRLKGLLFRDPLVQEFLKLLKQVPLMECCIEILEELERKGVPDSKERKDMIISGDAVGSFELRKVLTTIHSEPIVKTGLQILDKWHGLFFVNNLGELDYSYPYASVIRAIPKGKIESHGLFNKEKYIYYGHREEIAIQFNLSFFDLHDEAEVKRQVWKIVKNALEYRKACEVYGIEHFQREPNENSFEFIQRTRRLIENAKRMKKNMSCPTGISSEVAPFFHMRESTFLNYLKWYDIYTSKRFSFRSIAIIENLLKRDPGKAKQVFSEIELMGRRMEGGQPVKGEDAVRRGIIMVYQAIFRKKFNPKGMVQPLKEYSCIEHRNNCPSSCDYFKKWQKEFNRWNPV